jgi:hypothetical protein
MRALRASLLALGACLLAGCLTVTTTGRVRALENRIAVLEDQLGLARGETALSAKEAAPLSEAQRLRQTVTLLDLELEWLRANLGERHAKTVDTQGRRDRLAAKLRELDAGKGAR